MANERGKEIDKTHLSIDTAEERGFIHRDYIAHCLRWTHVIRYMLQKHRYKRADILDVGCGREFPLAKTLYTSKASPYLYHGIDVNKLERPEMFADKSWFSFEGETDVAELPADHFAGPFNLVVSFEVLEHVEPAHARRLLQAMHRFLSDDGVAFISTPVWDPQTGAAANHVNEMKYVPLGLAIEECGFEILNVQGTFASQKDAEPALANTFGPESMFIYHRLKEYYDSNYLATLFAPLVPWAARNCMWTLRRRPVHGFRPWFSTTQGSATSLSDVRAPCYRHPVLSTELSQHEPWTSSERWRELFPNEGVGAPDELV